MIEIKHTMTMTNYRSYDMLDALCTLYILLIVTLRAGIIINPTITEAQRISNLSP